MMRTNNTTCRSEVMEIQLIFETSQNHILKTNGVKVTENISHRLKQFFRLTKSSSANDETYH